ncbi:type III pantothenate kinase [Candidatus Desantisbacteria bacterium]|nr:type III pantothenate kinase [Candidatus Desantisbacteria bacterium]
MLLAIDIGNSNLVIGVFRKDKCINSYRICTDINKTSDEYGLLLMELLRLKNITADKIGGVVISSVVPAITKTIENMSNEYFKKEPLIVTPDINTEIAIKYHNPFEVGADRIVNAIAVNENYQLPAIIIDFGTATTFDYLTEKAEYLGGAIAPGIGISAQALFDHTARLPKVEILKPSCVIGRNTVSNIQSGIFYGNIGQIKEIIKRMKNEMGGKKVTVIATGGFLELIKQENTSIDFFVPDLTLQGLRLIYEKQKMEK